ncbi:MAG: hypothetical protein ACLSDM_08540 [Butyricicoccus sp.]
MARAIPDQWHVLARLSGNIEMYGGKTQTAARTLNIGVRSGRQHGLDCGGVAA